MATAEDSAQPSHSTQGFPGVVARSSFQLRSLPIRYRWEVSRRHPYYQHWWRVAQAYYRNEPVRHPAEPLLRQSAVVLLGMIGVSGEPPDPGTEFSDLEAAQLNAAWLSGAIHPVSLRGIAGLLIAMLPKETLGHVGQRLVEAGCDDLANALPRRVQAMLELNALDLPGLNSYADEPIVSVNPAASGRQITKAISDLLKQWKNERKLEEKRDRSDKYADYLRVWDLREGWTGEKYDLSREKKLKEVAIELGIELSTVNNHYRSAFEMIVGQPYLPDLWCRVFAVVKLMDLTGENVVGRVTHHRPLISPTWRPIPESVLGCVSQKGDARTPTAAIVVPQEIDICAMVEQIRGLLGQEPDDQRLADRLNLDHKVIPAIAYLRERNGELT
ncbi:MAG: hypothetical protein WCJ35_05685 [Planctomycetota bacterium]